MVAPVRHRFRAGVLGLAWLVDLDGACRVRGVLMTTRDHFRSIMAQRRRFRPGSDDHDYLSRAARKLAWILRGVPANEWRE